jgi:hypothetical protein
MLITVNNSVDFIGPENFITELSPLVKKITVLDHHKTGLELVDKLKAENKMPENGNNENISHKALLK